MRIFLLSLLLLGGCSAAPGGRAITGIDWRASNINGVPVAPDTLVTLRFAGKGVSGSSGCNSYSGNYELMSKEGIRFGALSNTEKACAPQVMEQEQRFLSIMKSVEGYSFYSDGSFSLISPDGRAIRFRR